MDAFRIVDAVFEIPVERFQFCFLLLHLRRSGADFAFHFPFVVGQIIPHFQDRLTERVILTERFVRRVKMPLTHFHTEDPCPVDAVGQTVYGNRHLTDFVTGHLHLHIQRCTATQIQQGALQFSNGMNNGTRYPPSNHDAEDQNAQRYIARVKPELLAQLIHLIGRG